MEKQFDVIVVGQVVQDILVTDVPEDVLTRESNTYLAGMIKPVHGGDGANESATLGKLGDHVAFLGCLGTDATGENLKRSLEEMHVDTSLAVRPENCRNIKTIVVIKTNAKHNYICAEGENFLLKKSDIDMSVFAKTRAVTAGSLFDLGELDLDGIGDIFREARKHGALTFADMNFDMKKRGPRAFDYLYPDVDYLMPSFEEAEYVTGKKTPEEMAEFFLNLGAHHVIIKLGEKGSFFCDANERFYTDPFDVEPVNTTGCGDNFVAGFVHSLLQGKTHREAALFANAIGALNSQGIGASLYVQSEAHVLDFMSKTKQRPVQR